MDSAAQIETLLEHADWVRRLAHNLVADPARAEDVAQETWLAALKTPPSEAQNLRGWLGTVVRNAARRDLRSVARREARQAAAAREEKLPSAAELVEQADLQRELAALVIALDEPYRQTLLLRYYQGLSAEEIATRANVPLNTVRTRVQRGLEKLRERLDRRFGEREAWCAALAPLARAPLVHGSIVSATGVLVMATKMKWLAAAALLVGLWSWWPREAAVAPTEELAGAPKAELDAIDTRGVAESDPLDRSRVALSPIPTAPAHEVASRSGVQVVSGRCVDLAGVPVAGLEIEWIDEREARRVGNELWAGQDAVEVDDFSMNVLETDDASLEAFEKTFPEGRVHGVRAAVRGEKYARPSVRTGIDGTFRIEQESTGGEIGLVRQDLMVLGRTRVKEFPESLLVIVPCVAVAGHVVDVDQHAIPGAQVDWSFSLQAARLFPFVIDGTSYFTEVALPAKQGRFEMARVPSIAGCELAATAGGFVSERRKVPDHPDSDVLFQLLRVEPRPGEQHIAGRVVHRDGRPGVGAYVSYGQDSDVAGADGGFRIRLSTTADEDTSLTAYVKGARPAATTSFGKSLKERGGSVDDAFLVLDEPLAPIRGHVVDAAGKPCKQWGIQLVGAQPWGSSNTTLEQVAAGESRGGLKTDAKGAFELGGLMDHVYRVRAWNSDSMIAIESEAVLPGTDGMVLRVPADALLERVRGRVSSRRGLPIDGATISLGLVTAKMGNGHTMVFREAGRTDADGRFELRDVPKNKCSIGVDDHRIESKSVEFDPASAEREVLIEVELDLRFRIEPRRAEAFDRFEILDSSGALQVVIRHLEDCTSSDYAVPTVDGEFP
ncbi:MAG TPA: RNA polymerase sigma factor, partial [Planctomycetota bacterium]|nr:RNA polymerase sigma factor [Planctomycetota bacterium]